MDKKEMGKKSRAKGKRFELKTKHDLESKGWIVLKWSKNVSFELNKKEYSNQAGFNFGRLIDSKNLFRGKGIPLMLGSGFPDFIAFRLRFSNEYESYYEIIGIESKMRGILDKLEKEKCQWLLEKNIFSKILVSKIGEKRGEIIYTPFNQKLYKV